MCVPLLFPWWALLGLQGGGRSGKQVGLFFPCLKADLFGRIRTFFARSGTYTNKISLGRFWCPTSIDAHGYALKNSWGYCADTCPAASSTLPVRVHKVDAVQTDGSGLQLRTVGQFRQTKKTTTGGCSSNDTTCAQKAASSVQGKTRGGTVFCFWWKSNLYQSCSRYNWMRCSTSLILGTGTVTGTPFLKYKVKCNYLLGISNAKIDFNCYYICM